MATTTASEVQVLTVGQAIATCTPFLREVRSITDDNGDERVLLLFAQGFAEKKQAKPGFLNRHKEYIPAPVVLAMSFSTAEFEEADLDLEVGYDVKPGKDKRWNEGGYDLTEEAILLADVFGEDCPIHMAEVVEDEDGEFVNPFTGKAARKPRPLTNPETKAELTHEGKRIMRFVALGEEGEVPRRDRLERDKVDETAPAAPAVVEAPKPRQRAGINRKVAVEA